MYICIKINSQERSVTVMWRDFDLRVVACNLGYMTILISVLDLHMYIN